MKMNLLKFSHKKNEKDPREVITKDSGTNFENILFKTSLILFFVLISVQIILVIPSVREKLNLTDKSIGSPLSNDEYLYNQGQVMIRLVGEEPDPTVKILVNGDEVSIFENIKMSVNVKNGDVVEIDGSESLTGHIIRVESLSSNINSSYINAIAKVENNIQRLMKVQVN